MDPPTLRVALSRPQSISTTLLPQKKFGGGVKGQAVLLRPTHAAAEWAETEAWSGQKCKRASPLSAAEAAKHAGVSGNAAAALLRTRPAAGGADEQKAGSTTAPHSPTAQTGQMAHERVCLCTCARIAAGRHGC